MKMPLGRNTQNLMGGGTNQPNMDNNLFMKAFPFNTEVASEKKREHQRNKKSKGKQTFEDLKKKSQIPLKEPPKQQKKKSG